MTGRDNFRIVNWTEKPPLTPQVLSLDTIRAKI